jgi:polyisoprenoid-binding protein YceI
MKIKSLVGLAASALTTVLVLGLAPRPLAEQPVASAAEDAKATKFSVDDVHSSLIFSIQHVGLTNFYGRFNDIDGHYTLDMANPEASSFDVRIKTKSVDTANDGRDKHLKSPDFFNAAEYPNIEFKSTKVSKTGDNTLQVTGDLTMHGVTKPLTLEMKVFPPREIEKMGLRSGVETTFTVHRTDFGVGAPGMGLGDDVTITVALEGK